MEPGEHPGELPDCMEISTKHWQQCSVHGNVHESCILYGSMFVEMFAYMFANNAFHIVDTIFLFTKYSQACSVHALKMFANNAFHIVQCLRTCSRACSVDALEMFANNAFHIVQCSLICSRMYLHACSVQALEMSSNNAFLMIPCSLRCSQLGLHVHKHVQFTSQKYSRTIYSYGTMFVEIFSYMFVSMFSSRPRNVRELCVSYCTTFVAMFVERFMNLERVRNHVEFMYWKCL